MKDTVEVLREARGRYAANPSHVPAPQMPEGGSICLVMAVPPVCDSPAAHDDALVKLAEAAECGVWHQLIDWNAAHSTGEVLALFDRAIAAEEQKLAEQSPTQTVPMAVPRRRDNTGCEARVLSPDARGAG